MESSYTKGNDFEKDVLKILHKTNPFKITHFNGGGDRGRDILVTYLIDNTMYDVIVQCKCYSSSVNVNHITSSIDWAKIHRPSLLYFWVCPYLTPDTKDYIKEFSKNYNITVDFEEEENIQIYLDELNKDTSEILNTLRCRILTNIKKESYLPSIGRFSSFYSPEECYLQDRVEAKEILLKRQYYAFYIQGVSCCGKTQLLKYVANIYYNQRKYIFWHTVHENSSEIQLQTFWNSLSMFFYEIYHSDELKVYFKEYGYYATDILYQITFHLLNKYDPILIIDDVHKCNSDNFELRTFWTKLIEKHACIIYYAGWFNIFQNTPLIQKNLKTIILEGMEKDDLNAIIFHNTGYSMPDVAQKIVCDYQGLPGFAMLVNEKTSANDFETDDTFLFSIINYLNEEEKIVLFTFVHSSKSLPFELFNKSNYGEAFYSLLQRRLLIKQNHNYMLHDKYKLVLSKYRMDKKLYLAIIKILISYSANEEECIFDIVQIYYHIGEIKNAFELLNKNFSKLLHKQLATQLLGKYQLIEKSASQDLEIREIILKKVVLLERCEKYELCKTYLELLEYGSLVDESELENLFYLKLRCFYFTNEYDYLLEMVFNNITQLINFNAHTYIQTFLLIGRIYYIRGLFNESLFFYLIAYERAIMEHDNILIVKTIHRIAMIEYKLGFIDESNKTFEKLLKFDNYISPKRKSYIYYRIAECNYKQKNYQKAKENNLKSIQIKESFNHKRGLIFSHRLMAKIFLKEKDFINTENEINIAMKIAEELELHKDEMACFILYIRLLKENNLPLSQDMILKLKFYINIAEQEKMLYRLKQINSLIKDDFMDLFVNTKEMIASISKDLEQQFINHSANCNNVFSTNCQSLYDTVVRNKKSISNQLLFTAGLYDPLETF